MEFLRLSSPLPSTCWTPLCHSRRWRTQEVCSVEVSTRQGEPSVDYTGPRASLLPSLPSGCRLSNLFRCMCCPDIWSAVLSLLMWTRQLWLSPFHSLSRHSSCTLQAEGPDAGVWEYRGEQAGTGEEADTRTTESKQAQQSFCRVKSSVQKTGQAP